MDARDKEIEHLQDRVKHLEGQLKDALQTIEILLKENEKLRSRVTELEKQLKLKNNDKKEPPSFLKPDRPKKRKRDKKGPRKGHKGVSRKVPDHIDEEDAISLNSCPDCGTELCNPFAYTTHYVEDIVPAHIVVRKHNIGWHWCKTCKKKVHARLQDAFANERFGNNLMALVSYQRILGMTVGKIRDLLNEQYGLGICDAAVLRMEHRVAEEMGDHYQELVDTVRSGDRIRADETGWRIEGKNHWLWTASTDDVTVYIVDRHRSGKVANDLLGPDHEGRVVTSDFFPAYNKVPGLKQKCLVHLLREFKKVESKKIELSDEFRSFKKKVKRLVRDAIRIHERITDPEIKARRVQRLRDRLRKIYSQTYSLADCKRIAKRLERYKDELFTFLEYEGVEWHNNDAERAIRPMVVVRKNSYGSRSMEGANSRCVLMSVKESLRKKGERYTDFALHLLSERAMSGTSKG